MPRILIIDDERPLTEPLLHYFTPLGWDATSAENGESGIASAKKLAPDIILLDMKLPDMDGIDILKRLKGEGCTASLVIMTGCGSIPNAVEAIKLGAEHYLTKPVELAELSTLMDRIMEMRKLRLENRYYQQLMDNLVVGVSMPVQKLHHMIDLMAENADTTVLLLGESGTGKELVAREIHRRSRRSERLFLDINCAVLSETLLESEMFGHERGAFTDAREFKPGLLEVADGGTVFLDEIGEMPLSVQPKLLRVLETHSFKRVGATRDVHVNVRIVAATNKDLSQAVAAGRFREDLYYRLKVFPVHIPPLRERPEDIPALVDHFVAQLNATLKKNITGFTPGAMDLLKNYAWPGNVRELRNIVERAMVLSKVTAVGADLLPREVSGVQDHAVVRAAPLAKGKGQDTRLLVDMERDYIVEVFHREKKNRSTTARALGISRSTLQNKLKKYGIT